jgi:hypothetical protein
MIFEHRSYTVAHGQMETYLARFEAHGLPLLMKHLGRLLGFHIGEIGTLNQVVHIWVYDSFADREQRRAALESDPEWKAFKVTNKGTFVHQEVKIMRGASFSPDHV